MAWRREREGMTPEMLIVKELKAKLSALGAPTDGLKSCSLRG